MHALGTALSAEDGVLMLDLRREAATVRPLVPDHPHLREAAVRTWTGRMVNEHGSARVFEGLAEQLEAAGVDRAEVERCREFAREERRHGALCGAVVEALGGEARAKGLPLADYPAHEDVGPLEAALRNMLSICCLSETVAVALIGAERLEMPDGELRELLTEIYADECGHANFGWRLLGELLPEDPQMRERLGDYLAVAFHHLEEHELAHLPVGAEWPDEGAELGLCNGRDARALFFATVEDIIIPGLEHRGLPARRAWESRRG